MRYLIVALAMLLYAAIPAHAQIGIGFRSHDVSISFHVSTYPRLVAIPGYPVYYDPRANSNYFFYDGLYWVYEDDNWYSSAWYDGPWDLVDPEYVPLFVLRVPVRYYRHRPAYFSGWSLDFAPRWGEHWGHDWEQHRSGWDRWDRHSVPRAAPLPSYQARYSGSRYPRAAEQQYSIQSRSYRYQPRETVTRQYFQQHAVPSGTHTETSQRPQPQQQPRAQQQQRARDQTQQQPRTRQQQQQQRVKDQAQRQPRAQQQQQQQERVRDQAQQQPRAQQQQQQQRARDQTQQQSRAQQQQQQQRAKDQAQQQSHARQQEQQQQRAKEDHAQQQSHGQQQQRAKDQAQQQSHAQQQQQQQHQQQQHVQQQEPARKGPSNQQQQRSQPAPRGKGSEQNAPQQKKEKDDKKDGGGADPS